MPYGKKSLVKIQVFFGMYKIVWSSRSFMYAIYGAL